MTIDQFIFKLSKARHTEVEDEAQQLHEELIEIVKDLKEAFVDVCMRQCLEE